MPVDFSYWVDIIKKMLVFALSIFLIYAGFKVGVFFMPFLIAFILAQLIEPLIRFCMKRFKLRRKVSAILIFFIILSIIVGIISLGVTTLITETTKFLENFNQYFSKISEVSQGLITNFDFNKIQVSDEIKTIIGNSTNEIIRYSVKLVKKCNY